jgi:hypothetical protein
VFRQSRCTLEQLSPGELMQHRRAKITAGSSMLDERKDLQESGYTLQAIGSDYIVQVKHRGSAEIVVQGNE